MNNKGQSLVVFVIILPILLVFISMVWEVGNLTFVKNKYEKNIKNITEYVAENDIKDLTKIFKLLDSNLDGTKTVTLNDGIIIINVKYKYESIYRSLVKDMFDFDITYRGYKENGKVIVRKE